MLYQYFPFLWFLANQLLMSKGRNHSCLARCCDLQLLQKHVAVVNCHEAWILSTNCPGLWDAFDWFLVIKHTLYHTHHPTNCVMTVRSFVFTLPWAVCFSWSYDYDVSYSDTSYGIGVTLEEGVFLLMCILCAIDYVCPLVTLNLLIGSKWDRSWQYWSALLSKTLCSPSALDMSSADG